MNGSYKTLMSVTLVSNNQSKLSYTSTIFAKTKKAYFVSYASGIAKKIQRNPRDIENHSELN